MPELSLTAWNDFLSGHSDAHILQSGEWGALKSSFGWEVVRLVENGIGAQMLFRRLPFGLTFGYIPKGPVGNPMGEAGKQFWAAVDSLCKKKHAVFLKLEQNKWEDKAPSSLQPSGFLPSPQHIQPYTTLVIELNGSEEEIFNRMKPKTRYNIRLAARKEVIIRPSDDLDEFYRVMGVTSQREDFHVHSRAYYQSAYNLFHPNGQCELLLADFHGQTLAAVMVFAFGKRGYYFYGASADVERNRKPTYPLQWEAIRWAYGRNCTEYDMWGIPDEATDIYDDEAEAREDGLWGVYRFKRGFGGTIKRAPQTLDRIYNPLLYKFYLWRFSGAGSD